MQAGVGLLVSDVMPIYMIIPRYSHNYAQFCQLLNGNSFTHRRKPMLLREATSETYGPRVYSHHINLHHFIIALLFLLCLLLFTLHLYIKNTKNIPSIKSHSRKWPWRAWQPLIVLVASSYRFVQVRGPWAWPLLDWYLGSQKLREILTLLWCIIPSSSGKTNASSRRSTKL